MAKSKKSKPNVKFKGFADLVDTVQIAQNFSDDSQAGTIIFRNLEAATNVGPVSTRVATLSIPLKGNDKSRVSVTQDIRGFVDADKGARASLVVQTGGNTKVINLKKSNGNDFIERITTRLGHNDDLQITFFLLAERIDSGNDEVGALLQIDSLDIQIVKGKSK
ncbi:MAG: hypothetical protein AAF394_14095 [Planctomycetota bacterium]